MNIFFAIYNPLSGVGLSAFGCDIPPPSAKVRPSWFFAKNPCLWLAVIVQ
jgi:hypothetical protein